MSQTSVCQKRKQGHMNYVARKVGCEIVLTFQVPALFQPGGHRQGEGFVDTFGLQGLFDFCLRDFAQRISIKGGKIATKLGFLIVRDLEIWPCTIKLLQDFFPRFHTPHYILSRSSALHTFVSQKTPQQYTCCRGWSTVI